MTCPASSLAAALPPAGGRLHLVGVCGTGMTPLACALSAAGWVVSGEDGQWSGEAAGWLDAAGVIRVGSGQIPEEIDLVIHSSAVKPGHATLAAARGRGVPCLRRGEALAALVRGRTLIAVAGSHGKTTTTAMLVTALTAAGFPCDYLLGGLFADGRTPPSRWAGQGWVVAEIDESDGTIEHFAPEITLCVNIDWDHCDRYGSHDAIQHAFAGLAARTGRAVFFNHSCPYSPGVFSGVPGPARRLSFGAEGEYALLGASGEGPARQVIRLGGVFGAVSAEVAAGGAFNAVNACGALAVAAWLGASDISSLLTEYAGVRRRQAILPTRPGVTLIEDYAHHPAEISALMESMRERTSGRLLAVFQPHRFTRTAQFKGEFARALARADEVFLLPVYAAGEAPVAGGTSQDVLHALAALAGAPRATLLEEAAAAPEQLAGAVRDHDLLVFIGAGDIDAVARATALLLRPAPAARPWCARVLAAVAGRLAAETVLRVDEPLGPKTTMHVGGAAELYAEPANTADLQMLVREARADGAPVLLLGRGSNLIVPDEGARGLVIRLQHAHWRRFVCLGPGRYWAGAGLRLKELCGLSCRMGETGFEFLEGIPGTVGGALRMNAGAMGGWFFEVVEQVHLLNAAGDLLIRTPEQMNVGYRRCDELREGIALGAVVRARGRDETAAIRSRMAVMQEKRLASQPREPSAGCIFKNPPGESAGRLIDRLGLKGLRVGDAEVSPVHANFIVNRGQATGADVIALVRRVREEVRSRCQVELEPEVLLYGREWREVL